MATECWYSAGGARQFLTVQEYRSAGASIVPHAPDAWEAEMVVKVKEPIAAEYRYLHRE